MPGKVWSSRNHRCNLAPSYAAKHLLCYSVEEPHWDRLPGVIKRELCILTKKSYNFVHDPKFYMTLTDIWEKNIDKRTTVTQVECAVCLDTYKLDGKDQVTTLMCGHHFCSKCIFREMAGRLASRSVLNVCCPLCRANVFENPERRLAETNAIEQRRLEALEIKRINRRHERWKKRQRAKEGK